MKTANQICKENPRLLGGFDNAQVIADAINNNDADEFKQAVSFLPLEAEAIIAELARVSIRNLRSL